jgi:hypothetical protein
MQNSFATLILTISLQLSLRLLLVLLHLMLHHQSAECSGTVVMTSHRALFGAVVIALALFLSASRMN